MYSAFSYLFLLSFSYLNVSGILGFKVVSFLHDINFSSGMPARLYLTIFFSVESLTYSVLNQRHLTHPLKPLQRISIKLADQGQKTHKPIAI